MLTAEQQAPELVVEVIVCVQKVDAALVEHVAVVNVSLVGVLRVNASVGEAPDDGYELVDDEATELAC